MVNLQKWLVSSSLPLWALHGVDRKNGGFFEKLDRNLSPSNDCRRARLVARQIYFFASGGSLGWHGPSEYLVNHGYNYLISYLIGPDGKVRATCNSEGQIIDSRQHLYDVAFVLTALARVVLYQEHDPDAEDLARRIAIALTSAYSHPMGGYFDEVTPTEQCSNPHMHLFEAFLAWAQLKRPGHEFWMERAYDCSVLALNKLILSESGCIPEFFDTTWKPVHKDGLFLIEPGHQFEWSWLLARWADLVDSHQASQAAEYLCRVAETNGVDHTRNAVFQSIDQHFQPVDLIARLWQQTERLKAWHAQFVNSGSMEAYENRQKAVYGLNRFIVGAPPGLWFETMDQSGVFIDESVKASSGYHVACAIETLSRTNL